MLTTDLLSPINSKPPFKPVRFLVIVLGSIILVGGLVAGSMAGYNQYYAHKVYPGVTLGNFALGGLTRNQVVELVETSNNRYVREGIPLVFSDKQGTQRQVVFSIAVANDASPETIKLNSEAVANLALSEGRSGSTWDNFWKPVMLRFRPEEIVSPLITDESGLRSSIKNVLAAYEDEAHDAILVYQPGKLTEIKPAKAGSTFNYEVVREDIETAMAHMSFMPVKATLLYREPQINKEAIEAELPKLTTMLGFGELGFNYTDPQTKQRKEWVFSPEQLAAFISVEKDESGKVIFTLDNEKVVTYIDETISPTINTEPKEAKFSMKDGKVESFQASQTGLVVDQAESAGQFITAFKARNYNADALIKTVPVAVKIVEPTVKTADVNSLGITEVIGVGISTFKNSPTNRIKNIAHAVKKLNGLLIKPGEVFSANKSAGPYTSENGYLPEAVIKGNQIIPEVGGGMCQVGTTLFRMAMNSGLPITERHNHSLAVSYYADPVNGNPGTDATLYEPVLDFKFTNETGNYLLLQTDIDYTKGELRFTLWGKPDGRSGSYTHPAVKRWIPAGEPQISYSDDGSLKPGEKKCQNAFRGAVASFTYTRFTTSGEKIDQVFDSYYRPLPQICVIGAEPGTVCNGQLCEQPTTTSTTVSVVN